MANVKAFKFSTDGFLFSSALQWLLVSKRAKDVWVLVCPNESPPGRGDLPRHLRG